MRAMTAKEAYLHAHVVKTVAAALKKLDRLPDDYRTNEDVAVARARLAEWLDDNADRWTV